VRDSFIRLVQVLATPLERLFTDHRTPVTLHRGIVRGQQLSRDHPLQLVSRPDADQRGDGCAILPATSFLTEIFEPQSLNGLIGENIVPGVGLRSTDAFQSALPIIGVVGHDSLWLIATRSGFFSRHLQSPSEFD
jgi:hypothetical protein